MKMLTLVLWGIIILSVSGCDLDLTQPSRPVDISSGMSMSLLAKAPVIVAALDRDLPAGTQYGPLADSSTVYSAEGDDPIPASHWVDNKYGASYEAHIYANVKVAFENLTTVTIASPVNLKYLNSSDQWIGIFSGATVTARAVLTDSLGSGTITVAVKSIFEDESEHGGGGQ